VTKTQQANNHNSHLPSEPSAANHDWLTTGPLQSLQAPPQHNLMSPLYANQSLWIVKPF